MGAQKACRGGSGGEQEMKQEYLEGLIYRAHNLAGIKGQRMAVVARYEYGRWNYNVIRASLAAELRLKERRRG